MMNSVILLRHHRLQMLSEFFPVPRRATYVLISMLYCSIRHFTLLNCAGWLTYPVEADALSSRQYNLDALRLNLPSAWFRVVTSGWEEILKYV
jgi:hypothetical protein